MQVTNSYCGLAALFPMSALAAAVVHVATSKRRSLNQGDGGYCRLHLTSYDCCLAHVMFSLSHSARTVRRSISSLSQSVLTATSPSSPVLRSGSWNHYLRCLLTFRRRRSSHGFNGSFTRSSGEVWGATLPVRRLTGT